MSGVASLLLGSLFGIGLVLAGMTDPACIRGFLDVTGEWRPELAFVMASALALSVVFFQLIKPKMAKPLLAERFSIPTASQVDGRLIGGAFLFGMGHHHNCRPRYYRKRCSAHSIFSSEA